MRRHLNDMLLLADVDRQAYSFLCQAEDVLYGPLALAVLDPSIVSVDFHHFPPDRWHGVVDMVDDITGAVKQQLKQAKLTNVGPHP